eukprot:9838806-Alexandrium_andersonii.AAC.1
MLARASLKPGKAAGGSELLVAEMVRCLPFWAVLLVHEAFVERYLGRVVEDIQSWHAMVLVLLPKLVNAFSLDGT